jgi:hypothetical protein
VVLAQREWQQIREIASLLREALDICTHLQGGENTFIGQSHLLLRDLHTVYGGKQQSITMDTVLLMSAKDSEKDEEVKMSTLSAPVQDFLKLAGEQFEERKLGQAQDSQEELAMLCDPRFKGENMSVEGYSQARVELDRLYKHMENAIKEREKSAETAKLLTEEAHKLLQKAADMVKDPSQASEAQTEPAPTEQSGPEPASKKPRSTLSDLG